MTPDRLAILRAYVAARLTRAGLRTRADVERLQARRWSRQAQVLARAPAFAALAGRPLAEFPVVEVAAHRADFDRRNTLGLDRDAALAAARAAEAGQGDSLPGGVAAGLSTGTGGVQGLFLASPAERAAYIGQALACLLPGPLWRPWRIALVLRADSALYRDVEGAGRFRFAFFGLDDPSEVRAAALAAFDPHILIAPAHVLADLALRGARLPALRRVLAGAEPLGEAERGWLARRFGAPVDPIYQATEGFLGAPCRLGTLHLNEDWLVIERAQLDDAGLRFSPVLTDLVRQSQPAVRLRLDDVLLGLPPCACGSPLAAVRVEGRAADIWRLGDTCIFPAEVEAAVAAALPAGAGWDATLTPEGVHLRLDPGPDPAPALAALARLLDGRAPATLSPGPPSREGPKRRRVRGLAP